MNSDELTELLATSHRLGVGEARRNFTSLVRKAADEPTIIERDGTAVAAIVDISELRRVYALADAHAILEAARLDEEDAIEYYNADNFIAAMRERTAARRAARDSEELKAA